MIRTQASGIVDRFPPQVLNSVAIKNPKDNTADIYLGGSTLTPPSGYPIYNTEGLTFDVDNLDKIYYYATASGNLIRWFALR